jgi:hypothetical protein
VSSKGGAIRQPASDLTAFDVSKRSPEDIARLFARWKQQRKSLQAPQPDARGAAGTSKPRPRLMPVMGRDAAVIPETASDGAIEPHSKTPRSVPYSAPFAAVLETGASGALADRLDNITFATAQKSAAAHISSGRLDDRVAARRARRSKSRAILIGAASILAVAAASSVALWTPSPHTGSNETPASGHATAPIVMPPPDVATTDHIAAPAPKPPIAARMAARLLPAASHSPVPTASPLQAAIDAGLMRPLPPDEPAHTVRLAPMLKPPIAEVQTASKTPVEESPEPIAASGMEIKPEGFVPGRPVSRSPSAVSVAIPAALTPQSGGADEAHPGTRPEALYRRGNDKSLIGDRGSHPQHGANGSRSSPGGGSGREGDDSGSGSSGSGGDPSSGTGGGAGGSTGADTGGSTGAGSSDGGGGTTGSGDTGGTGSGTSGAGGTGDSGSGNTGSGGDTGSGGSGSTSGGSTGGATGGGDAGGSTGGDGGSTGGDTGGADTSGDTGSGSGDSGSSDSGSGDSGSAGGGLSGHADVDVGGGGISGSVGGSVGGIGGSVGGSIGGGGGKIGGGLKL